MSIVRPCETCELHGSEVLWFLDMSPAGPSVFLLPSLSAVVWSLLPGSILWFSIQGLERWEEGLSAWWEIQGPGTQILLHHWAHQQSEQLWVLLPVSKTWSGLFQGGLLPLILFWRGIPREILVSQQSDVSGSVIAFLSLGFNVIRKRPCCPSPLWGADLLPRQYNFFFFLLGKRPCGAFLGCSGLYRETSNLYWVRTVEMREQRNSAKPI